MLKEKFSDGLLAPVCSNKGMNTKSKIPRVLKVELAGDSFYGPTFPKIRIQGKWLAALGFKPSGHVMIHATAPGEMLLKFIEPSKIRQ